MKIINLDELEQKCIEFGIKNGFFTKEDLNYKNLFTINLNGRYESKTCDIWFKDMIDNRGINIPLKFYSESWELLYSQLEHFFRDYWNYIKDNSKMPLYMKLSEAISKHSKNGYIESVKVFEEISKHL